ncbi:hypothetical protein QBC35DRAFT_553131 [Podospora australis]|uniref:Uncharacterized protein n=1 Tax=Podospora australis TaxID=1536484 RepID=A0AAN7AIL7_9PEZI|nr:hypothetical protein QBC35DRAFT_553131 [Podospora australis]
MREMNLPLRSLEASSAVGPFFWWSIANTNQGKILQLIFRKSDVRWNGTSRGWEVMLSYCFKTRITSGFLKGTVSAKLEEEILPYLQQCSAPNAHPLLLPFLFLNSQLSSTNDIQQQESRETIRQLEKRLAQRYKTTAAPNFSPAEDKRSQAWQNVVRKLQDAARQFWKQLSPEDRKLEGLRELHESIISRLKFISIKLDGLENYTHVSLERLALQWEVLNSIIDQRESRLSLEIAVQQQRLANSSRQDSISMKTLALLGAFILPGTFLSSMFSMPFFNFDSDMNGSVSSPLWIYFILMVPLTLIVVGAWILFDRASKKKKPEEDLEEAESLLHALEARITARTLRRRTGLNPTGSGDIMRSATFPSALTGQTFE